MFNIVSNIDTYYKKSWIENIKKYMNDIRENMNEE